MKEESKIEVAKLSAQLTAELLKDKNGRLNELARSKKLGAKPNPLDVFDAIFAHVSETITKE